MDRGRALLELLEANTRAHPSAPFQGRVSVGVRTESGFRFWTFARGQVGAGRSWVSDRPPEQTDALVCLTARDLEALLAGRRPSNDMRRRFSGDPEALRQFVRSYVDPPDLLSIRSAR